MEIIAEAESKTIIKLSEELMQLFMGFKFECSHRLKEFKAQVVHYFILILFYFLDTKFS